MFRCTVLSFLILLSAPFAQAASPFVGYWRTAPEANDSKSERLPETLLYVRQGPDIFVVELVTRNIGTFFVREYPASLRDGILRVAMPEGEVGLGFDAERGVLVGAACRRPCMRIDAATFTSLKDAAIKYRPTIPKIQFPK